MSREVWGTFAVSDHCIRRAFVADVFLYDQLVIPVPSTTEKDEWQTWIQRGWNPERQQKLIDILRRHGCVRTVEWDAEIRGLWAERMSAAAAVAQETAGYGLATSRAVLTLDLPPGVTGVESITAYPSVAEIERDLLIQRNHGAVLPASAVTAILGREFLVPDDPALDDEHLLQEAASVAADDAFKRKRRQYWRWQREFLGNSVNTDEKLIAAALDEMRELLEEQKTIVRKLKLRTMAQYAFLVASVSLTVASAFLGEPSLVPASLAMGGAFVSIGQFAAEKLLSADDADLGPAAMFYDVQRHFGWREK